MKKRSFRFYFFTAVSVYVLILFILQLDDLRKKKKESIIIDSEYLDLRKNIISINSILKIKELSQSMFSKGTWYLTFENGSHYSLSGVNYNWLYQIPNLGNFVETGDSISKKVDNDSIFIYRDSQEYYFVLGEVINKKAKK